MIGMKHIIIASALVITAACASTTPYGPASKPGAEGYDTQQIEDGRFRVSYTSRDAATARNGALLRAAEKTLETGSDWFEITNNYVDQAEFDRRSGGSSVSVGGSSGSYGSGVGVGVGIGLPLGGGSSARMTEVLEIVTGKGEKPDRADAYDARSVQLSLHGTL